MIFDRIMAFPRRLSFFTGAKVQTIFELHKFLGKKVNNWLKREQSANPILCRSRSELPSTMVDAL